MNNFKGEVICPECKTEYEEFNREIFGGVFFIITVKFAVNSLRLKIQFK